MSPHTHPLGPGTVNLAVNLFREERSILGRLATEHDESIGHLIRRLVCRGLECESPELAARLRTIRRESAKVACLAVALLAIGQGWWRGNDVMRRAPSRVRIVRIVRRGNREVEEVA